MKRVIILYLCVVLMFLSACSNKLETVDTAITISAEEPTIMPTVSSVVLDEPESTATFIAVSVPLTTDITYADDTTEVFSYSYQYMQLECPDESIAQKITLEFLNRVDSSWNDAQVILNMAQADISQAQQWIPYFYRVIYNPVRIDYSVLSLHGMQSSYSGGMHGNVCGVAANYDMLTGEVLTFGSIMHMDAQKEDFVNLILGKLEYIADDYYLYDDYESTVRQRLNGDENLYEDFYFTTTGLNFFFSPYEIAPYASGIISVEIPYAELQGLLYDDYFPTERNSAEGKLETDVYGEKDIEHLSYFVELYFEGEDELYLLYPVGTVEDIRIAVTGDKMTIPDYTAFLAYQMSDCDAIILEMVEGFGNRLNISYQSGSKKHNVIIYQ